MDGKKIVNTQPPSQPWPVQANLIAHRCKESNPPNLINIPSNERKGNERKRIWDLREWGREEGIDLVAFGIRHLGSISIFISLIIKLKYIFRSIHILITLHALIVWKKWHYMNDIYLLRFIICSGMILQLILCIARH